MALLLLLDMGKSALAMGVAAHGARGGAKGRTLDPIAERVYFMPLLRNGRPVRRHPLALLAAHRTACLHHNTVCQATLLNALLRNLLHYKLFDQAEKLLTKTTFPVLQHAGAPPSPRPQPHTLRPSRW